MEASRLRLWEITTALDAIGERIAESGGEITPELEAELDAMEGAFDERVERIALFVKECDANAAAAEKEVERLAAIQKAFEKKAEGLKRYLHGSLTRSGRTSVKTPLARVWVQANGRPSIRWTRPGEFPEGYTKTTTVLDTQRAYEDWKAGSELPDGFAVEQGTHLRIG